MNITGENITEDQLTTALGSLINFALDNEQAFFDRFYTGFNSNNKRLHEFYIASRQCRIMISDVGLSDGAWTADTIRTADYIEWVENLRNLQGKGVAM